MRIIQVLLIKVIPVKLSPSKIRPPKVRSDARIKGRRGISSVTASVSLFEVDLE